jgi:hypothetical protein
MRSTRDASPAAILASLVREPAGTTLALGLMAIGATLLYLGLAVLGWGGFAALLPHPSLMALSGIGVLLGALTLVPVIAQIQA